MKNKWTLTLAISTIVIASLTVLMIVLGLVANAKMYGIYELNANSSYFIQNFETARNTYIVLMLFALVSIALAITGIIFHKKMKTKKYKLWFFASVVASLAMSFGLLVQPLASEFITFSNLDKINDISSTTVTGLGGNVYGASSKTEISMKPYELIIAYTFAIKAAISAVSALVLIGSTILILREVGLGFENGETISKEKETKTSKTNSVKGYISSKKTERSLDMLTKAKALLDSKAITQSEFDAIKEREMSL